jgi:signal transduction histidine kinase
MWAQKPRLHIHKPEFHADAIRTLGDVTARMQRLLALLRSPDAVPAASVRSVALAPAIDGWLKEMALQLPPRIRLETLIGWIPEILLDPEQFRSVLQNLIVNGMEAIPDEGTITVETRTENGTAVITVSDTGQGIDPEFLRHRLFRPFQTTKTRGLGIGLYQCRQILQQLGGTLSVESEVGRGTRMIVRLPAGN